MPQTFRSPKPSAQTSWSALKFGLMSSYKRPSSRQPSFRTEQTKLRRLHSHRLCRELSRLGVFPDFLLDRSQFLLLSLPALLGPLLATLGPALFRRPLRLRGPRHGKSVFGSGGLLARRGLCWRSSSLRIRNRWLDGCCELRDCRLRAS